MKIISLPLPEYQLIKSPDFSMIGKKIDQLIGLHFPNKWIAIRGISLKNHPEKSINWLIAKIQELGSDRYDPNRKGVHDDMDKEFGIELHAVPMIFQDQKMICPHYSGNRGNTGSPTGDLLSDCYHGAAIDRGYSLRIDILLIYDLNLLKSAPMIWTEEGPMHSDNPRPKEEACEFQFLDSSRKQEALLGVVKLG